MDFFETVEKRHSVRKFEPRRLEQDSLDKILDTINKSPSAGDLQGYEIVLVGNADTKQALVKSAYGQSFIEEAPAILIFCANHLLSAGKYGQRGAELYSIQDATIAASYAQLAATALGLASVWVGAFDTQEVSSIIQTPVHVTPVAIIPIGYAAEEPAITPRRSVSDIVHMEKF